MGRGPGGATALCLERGKEREQPRRVPPLLPLPLRAREVLEQVASGPQHVWPKLKVNFCNQESQKLDSLGSVGAALLQVEEGQTLCPTELRPSAP